MTKSLDSIRESLGRYPGGSEGSQMLRAEAHGDAISLTLSGNLTIGEGDEQLNQAIAECILAGVTKIVVDLGDARAVDSAGIGELLASSKLTKRFGGSLVLSNVPPTLKRILQIAAVDSLFNVYESVEEALDFLSPERDGPFADGALYELEAAEEDLVVARPRLVDTTVEIIQALKSQPDSFYSLQPRVFEEVVASLLNDMGLEVHLTGRTRDGGRDILAYLNTEIGRFLCLVEAKRFRRDRKVGVDLVRSLYGVLFHEQANSGLLVTTSDFSADARAFQQEHRYQLQLKGYTDLTKWVKAYGTGARPWQG